MFSKCTKCNPYRVLTFFFKGINTWADTLNLAAILCFIGSKKGNFDKPKLLLTCLLEE